MIAEHPIDHDLPSLLEHLPGSVKNADLNRPSFEQYYAPFLILACRQKGLSFGMIGVLIRLREIGVNLTGIPSSAVGKSRS